ncbi:DNA translocase FtsK, partial [Azorhizobium doebereinerae]|uniref:DNA translocase FtsK n=1 Tax=Azorhizobium doebereinerae TaxID=281091 RepID=UPI002475B629
MKASTAAHVTVTPWIAHELVPSWLQPFTIDANTRFTRTPEYLMRPRKQPPEPMVVNPPEPAPKMAPKAAGQPSAAKSPAIQPPAIQPPAVQPPAAEIQAGPEGFAFAARHWSFLAVEDEGPDVAEAPAGAAAEPATAEAAAEALAETAAEAVAVADAMPEDGAAHAEAAPTETAPTEAAHPDAVHAGAGLDLPASGGPDMTSPAAEAAGEAAANAPAALAEAAPDCADPLAEVPETLHGLRTLILLGALPAVPAAEQDVAPVAVAEPELPEPDVSEPDVPEAGAAQAALTQQDDAPPAVDAHETAADAEAVAGIATPGEIVAESRAHDGPAIAAPATGEGAPATRAAAPQGLSGFATLGWSFYQQSVQTGFGPIASPAGTAPDSAAACVPAALPEPEAANSANASLANASPANASPAEADDDEADAAPGHDLRPADAYAYELPPLELLAEPPVVEPPFDLSEEFLEQNSQILQQTLRDFGVRGEIIDANPGPVVTLYELEPAPGTKSSRVIGLAADIARSMSAISARVAVVEGRNVIGIELPNRLRETVWLRELLADH